MAFVLSRQKEFGEHRTYCIQVLLRIRVTLGSSATRIIVLLLNIKSPVVESGSLQRNLIQLTPSTYCLRVRKHDDRIAESERVEVLSNPVGIKCLPEAKVRYRMLIWKP